ncbi:MAG: signal recognition particle protein [Chloroflexota bacterium]|nr:signal recognition particle protein [Chloroflexota bacterium]MDE2857853.1 signal recognition particle protein [Chloroflexota bacterium]
MFESLSQRLDTAFEGLRKGGTVKEADVKAAMREVRMALLEADVALPIVKDFIKSVRERAIGEEVHKALKPSEQVVKIIHEELVDMLGEAGRLSYSGSVKPHVIMLVGLQGSGKTTNAAKLALHLRGEGRRPFMIAADTYRPAAVDQLVTLAKQISVPYYEEGTSDKPPAIVRRGIKMAKDTGVDIVIIDTAGRLQIDENLMGELEDIKRIASPAEILLVADAMTGQEAVNIARGFNERLGITGLVLTKVDGDARGGAALSMRAVTGVPIKYMGTGEKVSADTLELFHPDRIAQRILGMGDIMSLIEKTESVYEEEEALRLQDKIIKNEFTLQDFLDQLQKIRRMGPLGKVMGMIPGMSKLQMQADFDDQDIEKRIRKVEAIINSMTPTERQHPRILKASRKRRIASGSGVEVRDVNELLKQFRQMSKLMNQLSRGKVPHIPGLNL